MNFKTYRLIYIGLLLTIIISIFLPFSVISKGQSQNIYSVPQKIEYQVDVNFTLTNLYESNDYYFKIARLNDRIYDPILDYSIAPYQQSILQYNNIINSNSESFLQKDQYNNIYDIFNTTLEPDQSVSLSQKYNIILSEVLFEDIEDYEIGNYNMSSMIFKLYCNQTEPFFDRNDPDLIFASNNLTGINYRDNPIEKAEKICNWIGDYLIYDDSLNYEMGASWAYDNHRGDCSEFSDIMITLLRIQNIPARKVSGFLLSNQPIQNPHIGQIWNFSTNIGIDSLPFIGHAWVEYYVDNVGWIASDPTWHQLSDNYFNRIDFQRFTFNIGENFSVPLSSNFYSEFPQPYKYTPNSLANFNSEYYVNIKILNTYSIYPESIPYFFALIPISIFLLIIIIYRLGSSQNRQILTNRRKFKIDKNPRITNSNISKVENNKPSIEYLSLNQLSNVSSQIHTNYYQYPEDNHNNFQINELPMEQSIKNNIVYQSCNFDNEEIRNLRNQAEYLNLEILNKDKEIRELIGYVSNMQSQLFSYEKRKEQLNQETYNLIQKVQSTENSNLQLQREIAPLYSEINILANELKSKENKIKKLKQPKSVMVPVINKNLSNRKIRSNTESSQEYVENSENSSRKLCPKCGAVGSSLMEIIDRNRIISYTPIIIYRKINKCKKCGKEF
ncbi:MAG: hypothetical protein JXA99_13245 [Candidatus Lokiarchaeota archaeon]|nr:hypothetical protein [Candidatus Lokiarchaeota archaeon]